MFAYVPLTTIHVFFDIYRSKLVHGRPLHILLVVVDDFRWSDVGFHRSKVKHGQAGGRRSHSG